MNDEWVSKCIAVNLPFTLFIQCMLFIQIQHILFYANAVKLNSVCLDGGRKLGTEIMVSNIQCSHRKATDRRCKCKPLKQV